MLIGHKTSLPLNLNVSPGYLTLLRGNTKLNNWCKFNGQLNCSKKISGNGNSLELNKYFSSPLHKCKAWRDGSEGNT